MKNQSQHKLATISFVVETTEGVDLWPTIECNDYIEANRIGRDRASEILQYAIDNQAPMLFGHVTAAIIGKGLYGPGEIGFFHEIASRCIGSSECVISDAVVVDVAARPVLKIVVS